MQEHRRSLALTPQSIDVPMYVSQDSSIDPRVLQPGAVAVVENGRLFYRGQVRKRFGFTPTQNAPSTTAGVQVLSGGSQLLHHDGATLRAYAPSIGAWNAIGSACGGQVRNVGAIQNVTTVQNLSSAATAALAVVSWTETGNSIVWYSVIDLVTGNTLVSRSILSTNGQSPNVLVLNSNFYIFWGDLTEGQNTIQGRYIPGSAPSTIVNFWIPADPSSETLYDVCVDNTGTQLLLVTDDTSRGTSSAVGYSAWRISGYTPTALAHWNITSTLGPSAQPSCFNCSDDGSGTIIGACWIGSGYKVLSTSGVAYTQTSAWAGTAYRATGTPGYLFLQASPYPVTVPGTFAYNSAGAVYQFTGLPNVPAVCVNAVPISRAFVNPTGNDVYVWCKTNMPTGYMNILLNTAGQIVGYQGENGAGAGFITNDLCHVTNDGAGNYLCVMAMIQTLNSAGAISSTYLQLVNLALGQPHLYAQQIDTVTYLGGPAPQIFDGQQLVEWGFLTYPQITITTTSAGGNLTGGTYLVSACYSWTDATGKVWRSPTATQQEVVVATTGAGSMSVSVSSLWLTAKTNVTVEVYCTANIGGQSGSPLYLVATSGNQLPVLNSSVQPPAYPFQYQSFSVTGPDTTIATGLQLYTNGGVPDYLTPPSMVHMSSSGLRLYSCCGEDNQVYVTSPATPGTPLNFLESQSVAVESVRGGLIASQAQDGNLWIGTKYSWFLTNADVNTLVGEGQGNVILFAPPARAAFADGCQSGPSVFPSAQGVYYQSQRGIELLSRQQQPVFVGEPVKNITGTVLDTYVVPAQQQIRFIYANYQLCYDYERQTWLQHVFSTVPTLVAGCQWQNLGVIADPLGVVRLEGSGFFDDYSTPIILRVQTPWIRLGGLAGWTKTWSAIVLGEYESAHTLQAQIAYSNDPTWIDTLTISGSPAGGNFGVSTSPGPYGQTPSAVNHAFGYNPAGNPYQFEFLVPRADTQAIKFEFTTQSSTGEDCRWNYITIIGGVQPNVAGHLPIVRTTG